MKTFKNLDSIQNGFEAARKSWVDCYVESLVQTMAAQAQNLPGDLGPRIQTRILIELEQIGEKRNEAFSQQR